MTFFPRALLSQLEPCRWQPPASSSRRRHRGRVPGRRNIPQPNIFYGGNLSSDWQRTRSAASYDHRAPARVQIRCCVLGMAMSNQIHAACEHSSANKLMHCEELRTFPVCAAAASDMIVTARKFPSPSNHSTDFRNNGTRLIFAARAFIMLSAAILPCAKLLFRQNVETAPVLAFSREAHFVCDGAQHHHVPRPRLSPHLEPLGYQTPQQRKPQYHRNEPALMVTFITACPAAGEGNHSTGIRRSDDPETNGIAGNREDHRRTDTRWQRGARVACKHKPCRKAS